MKIITEGLFKKKRESRGVNLKGHLQHRFCGL